MDAGFPGAQSLISLQPFYFEDLVAAGTERGLIDRGWKNVLKKYLDDQVRLHLL